MSSFNIYIGTIRNKKEDWHSFKFGAIQVKDNVEEEVFYDLDETTQNRALILGTVNLLNNLPNSSKITMHFPTNIGFKYIKNMMKGKSASKWTNKDIGTLLVDAIKDNNHKVSFKDYSELESPTELIRSIKPRLKGTKSNTTNNHKSNQIFDFNENIYNNNDLATTDVSIFVRGICDYSSEDRNGCYYSILSCKGTEKEISKKFKNTTSNRMVVQGAIDAIKLLKKPCNIKLYTHTAFGLVKFNKSQKGVNSDLLAQLFELLKEGSHSLEEILGTQRQEELKEKILLEN